MSDLDRTYSALADPTRRAIVERLGAGEATVAELRAPLTMSAAAVSKHLRVLESAGIVERRKAGRHRICQLRRRQLDQAREWLVAQTAFWESTLDSLADHLAGDDQ